MEVILKQNVKKSNSSEEDKTIFKPTSNDAEDDEGNFKAKRKK